MRSSANGTEWTFFTDMDSPKPLRWYPGTTSICPISHEPWALPFPAASLPFMTMTAIRCRRTLREKVVVQGSNVMLGYFGKPTETATVIRNGWLYTGDLGHLDTEGYLTLTGLKKDLIITSGFNVYCQEVEEILVRHPHVADVALVGVPDLMRGQVIEALVVPEPGVQVEEREIIRFCKEYLSRYKCPRKVTLVKEIVRDAHGKASGWR